MGCFSSQKPKKKFPAQSPKPEPSKDEPLLSAPPSFRSRVRAIQNAQRFINSNPKLRSSLPSYGSRENSSRDAPLSSPTAPSMGGRARSATAERGSSLFDITTLRSRPMPLPSPQRVNAYRLPLPNDPSSSTSLSPSPSFTSPRNNHSPTTAVVNGKVYPSDLQPLPPPKEPLGGLRSFVYDELATACPNFDRCVADSGDTAGYNGILKVKAEKQEITVVQICERWQQDYKEWMAELSTIVRLHGSHLCKLIGFYADEELTKRFIVYEKLSKGGLDDLLFGSSDSLPLDWPTRVKIACGAVQGLASLHDKSPGQVLYHSFRSSNIQVDVDYSSKLSGYYFVATDHTGCTENTGICSQRNDEYRAPETVNRGEITIRSNVWSVGILFLELLSGRQNKDYRVPGEESNLVKWAKPFLMDESSLFLVMDPKLQGRFPSKGVRMVADLALQCLHADPAKRPTMRKVADIMKCVQEMRYAIRFPLKEPNTVSPPRSPSSGIGLAFPIAGQGLYRDSTAEGSHQRSFSQFDVIESPQLRPLIIPPRSFSTSFAMEENLSITQHKKEYKSGPLERQHKAVEISLNSGFL